MHKILLILQREYLTRVRKKSFIVMTLVGPILMAGLILAPALIAAYSSDQEMRVQVIDQHPEIIRSVLPSNDQITFIHSVISLDSAKNTFDPDRYDGILFLPADLIRNPGGAMLFTESKASLNLATQIESVLERQIEEDKLKSQGINRDLLESAKTSVDLKTLSLSGEESSAELASVVGLMAGALIYIFIFLYGVQVMRGVIEEKTSRIVEVIISSVKPFELMMGKIIGIALVGLTQFLLWITLTGLIAGSAGNLIRSMVLQQNIEQGSQQPQNSQVEKLAELGTIEQTTENPVNKILNQFSRINFGLILVCFLIYFLGGYLLYSALFAAIGSAVDNETETQQFMLPVTIPLIISFIAAQTVIQDPESSLSFWLSIFPLTSPIIMMVRIAFGVPAWELALSITLLIGGFILTTALAGRIYRTGILLYGKKVNYKELYRWLFYKG
jgi:ABC-2 type transport system permease protein